MSKLPIILNNRLYVPKELVTNEMYNAFTYTLGDPSGLDYVELQMFKDFQNGEYVGFLRGDLGKIGHFFKKDQIIDQRAQVPTPHPELEFTGSLRPAQKDIILQWIKKGCYGLLQAAPRSGKCTLGDSYIFTKEHGMIQIQDLFDKNHEDDTFKEKKINTITNSSACKPSSHIYADTVPATYKLTTDYGYEVQGTPEHPVQVVQEDLSYKWKRLDEIKEGDLVCINRSRSLWAEKDYPGMTKELASLIGSSFGDKPIPRRILQSTKEIITTFLVAYFSNKHFCIRSNCTYVASASLELIRQLQILLLNYNIISKRFSSPLKCKDPSKRVCHFLYLRDLDVKLFYKIFFPDRTLELNLEKTEVKDFLFDPVKKISKVDQKVRVYDLSIPGDRSFVANGIVIHNTIMVTYLACKLKQKTLILVHQDELAQQFYNKFVNYDDPDQEFTNARLIEKKTKSTIVGIARSLKDVETQDWAVTIMTYQKFLRHMGKLKEMKDKWGAIFVDEAHYNAACKYSEVINITNSRYRCGCTATPKRKDELHVIVDNTLGPVTAQVHIDQMKCKVSYFKTDYHIKPFATWTTLISRLCASTARNEVILERIRKRLDEGKCLLVTTTRVKHAEELTFQLQELGYTAALLVGKTPNRKKLLDDIRAGKYQVTVANRKITQVGLDVPAWDTFLTTVPNQNKYNYLQECSRIRTPYEGKPMPTIDIPIDTGHSVCYAIKNGFHRVHKAEGFIFEKT